MKPESIQTRVPATSANLGPGFDCLGVALDMHNCVEVSRQRPESIHHSMAIAASHLFFERAGVEEFPFSWKISGQVPRSRGLGSSVTVRLGILHGLNSLAGNPFDREAVFRLCAELEGHPDNAAPAEFGGLAVCGPDGSVQRFEISPGLHFVLFIPELELSTDKAREVLPIMVPHAAAAANTASACAIVAALVSGRLESLRGVFQDHLHESYRAKLLPGLTEIIRAGVEAGALGGYLSGAGSGIACLALDRSDAVAEAMRAAARGLAGTTRIVCADNRGTIVQPSAI